MTAGSRLAEVRHTRGLTQPQLAAMVGISVPTLQNYERNRTEPTRSKLEALAKALQVSLATLARPVGSPIPAVRNNKIEKIVQRVRRGGGGYTALPFVIMLCC